MLTGDFAFPNAMAANVEFGPERRRCLRQSMHAPAFASFDGVSGGMILDLSEEGLSMRAPQRLERDRRVRVEVDLQEPAMHLETTGYIAWADALGRAGVRFSDLPAYARQRLNEWLKVNEGAPSQIAPKLKVGTLRGWGIAGRGGGNSGGNSSGDPMSISLEAEADGAERSEGNGITSATVQYEFNSLGTDLSAALRLIGERARALTRGTSAAIALAHKDLVICRTSLGESAPGLGARLDVNSGLSGECFREGKAVRCDDAENDPRVDWESCRRLNVRSIVAAPVRYERDTVGLLMVLAPHTFNFDEGDVAVVESLANIVVRTMRQTG